MKKTLIIFLFVVQAHFGVAQSTQANVDSLQKYFTANKDFLDPIEGVWDVVSTKEYYKYDTLYDVLKQPIPTRVVIIKKDSKCQSFKITGEPFDVEFSPTDVKNVYLYRNFFPLINQTSDPHAIINRSGTMEYTFDVPEGEIRIKMGNKYTEGMRMVNVLRWTKIF